MNKVVRTAAIIGGVGTAITAAIIFFRKVCNRKYASSIAEGEEEELDDFDDGDLWYREHEDPVKLMNLSNINSIIMNRIISEDREYKEAEEHGRIAEVLLLSACARYLLLYAPDKEINIGTLYQLVVNLDPDEWMEGYKCPTDLLFDEMVIEGDDIRDKHLAKEDMNMLRDLFSHYQFEVQQAMFRTWDVLKKIVIACGETESLREVDLCET